MSKPEAQPGSPPKGGWLRDPIWQFIAVPVALVAIVWTIYTFFFAKPVRSLSFVVLSNTSLVQVQGSVSNDTTVLYKGQPIHNLSIVTVKLENDGNQAIREADYAKPITFIFPAGSNVVNAAVTDSNPPNVGITVQANHNTATVSQSLLNSGDRVIIELMVADLPSDAGGVPFALDARIVDIKSVVPISAIAVASTPKDATVLSNAQKGLLGILILVLLGVAIFGTIRWLTPWLLSRFSQPER
jgi:hypothetical protein